MSLDDDLRRERLKREYAVWEVWYLHVSDARTSWACRPVGVVGEPSFTTFSFEELELYLATADPTALTL
jgi:hypothetical protein